MYGSVLPPQSLKPKEEFLAYRGKMEGITTFKSDSRPYEIVKQPRHAPEEYKPKQGEIDLGTTYKRHLNSCKVQRVAIARPLERQVKKGKWDTVPTYKDDYRAWDIWKSELYKQEQTYYPPTVKLGSTTTFQDDCVPCEIKPRQSFKPSPAVKRSSPLNGDTSHRLDYVPYQLEFKFSRPKEVYKPTNQQPLEDLTTHYDFQGLVGENGNICRPPYTRVFQNAEFEGSTEFRDSFQPWEIPPPEVKKVQEYVPPAGIVQLHSTSHIDYVPYEARRVVPPIRPVSCRRNNSFPFQGKSTTKEDFPAQESCCQRLIKQEQQIPNPSGKFDSLSTFRSPYMPHELIPTESCKPVNVLCKSSIPFDDITVYSPECAPKKQEICPASNPSPPGYIFENTNSRGHKFFHTIAPTVKAF
ncbi:LOW QUALITY PROTEIN: stabilizer of axonemal microtubules 2 [Megaptera novaeangliae]